MYRWLCTGCVLAGILLWGCNDDDPTAPENSPTAEFPNAVGSQWVYAVHDSVRETSDTITVTITDTITMPQNQELASIWVFDRRPDRNYGHFFDTLFITDMKIPDSLGGGDTIKIYAWSSADGPSYIHLLPTNVGDHWSCETINDPFDSTHVEGLTTIATPAGTLADVYRVYHRYNCGDECAGYLTFWFKPGIGIVLSNRLEWDIFDHPEAPQLRASWTLLKYVPAP